MNTPLVSVIMGIYNTHPTLIRQSIDSIINQTFKDYEFIIINDDPKDHKLSQLLNEYKRTDIRIVLINNKVNIGLTKSLNKGISIAKGKYIARMDADDISFKNRFLEQVELMENNDGIVVSGTWVQMIGLKNRKWNNQKKTNDEIRKHCMVFTPILHPTAFIRKSILDRYKITYNENLQVAQDLDLWFKLMDKGLFYNLPQYLLYYRVSNVQVTQKRRQLVTKNANEIKHRYISKFLEEFNVSGFDIPKSFSLGVISDFKKARKKLLSSNKINSSNYNEFSIKYISIHSWLYLSMERITLKTLLYYIFSFDIISISSIEISKRILAKYIYG